MSVRVMADVYDFGPADAVDCAVLLVLANHANDDGRSCYPSLALIAAKSRYSEKTVSRAIAMLETDGWITVKRGRGRGVVSEYTVCVERLKRGHSLPFCEKKTGQSVSFSEKNEKSKKGTLTTEKGDSGGNPPAPPNRKNRQEPSITKHPHSPQGGNRQILHVRAGGPSKPIPKRFRKRRARDGPPDAQFIHRGPPMSEEVIRELREKMLERERKAAAKGAG